MTLSPWPAASICAPAGSSPMPSTWRWGLRTETAVARRESGPHWDCVFSADRPRRALATVRQAGEPRHHRPIAGAEFHCRRPAQSAAGRALHLRHHQTIPAHFGFDTLRNLPDIEQLEETGLLSKQKLLAGEALAGESSSLDLMNIDEEGRESLATNEPPRTLVRGPLNLTTVFLVRPATSSASRALSDEREDRRGADLTSMDHSPAPCAHPTGKSQSAAQSVTASRRP
jgi:hypothetical protein